MISTLLFDFKRVFVFPNSDISSENQAFFQPLAVADGFGLPLSIDTRMLDFVSKNHSTYTTAILSASDLLITSPSVLNFIEPYFDHILSTKKLGISKDLAASYFEVAEMLDIKPEEMLFTDDQPSNIVAAQEAKLKTIQFTTAPEYIQQAEQILTTQS